MIETQKSSNDASRLAALDGWRGIACVLVVIFHIENRYIFWMYVLVDMFFILSGFLISRIIMNAALGDGLNLRNFWIRRVLRVWPVYYVGLILAVPLNFYLLGAGETVHRHTDDFFRSVFYLQFTELYFLENPGKSDVYQYIKGMLHTWSLAIEEQFYLIAPLLITCLIRITGVRGVWCAALALLGVGWYFRADGLPAYTLLSRMDGLVFGLILALLFQAPRQTHSRLAGLRPWLFLASLYIGLAMCLNYLQYGYSTGSWNAPLFEPESAHILFGLCLIFFAAIGASIEAPNHRFLAPFRSRIGVYLGTRSYSIYIIHLPVIALLKEPLYSLLDNKAFSILIMTGASIILGDLLKRYIEDPFMRMKKHYPVNKKNHSQ